MAQCGVKFRAFPTTEQKHVLAQWVGCARFIYNAKCSEDTYYRTFRSHSLQHTGQSLPIDQTYSQFKTDLTPWLKDCPSQILRNSAVRWYEAYQRFSKGLGGRPRRKRNDGRGSVWLTQELFKLTPEVNLTTGEASHKLYIGTKTNNLGYLSFFANRSFKSPKSVTISRDHDEWYVSFSYEDGTQHKSEEELFGEYARLDEATLEAISVGLDRGVAIPVRASDGTSFDLTPEQKDSLASRDRRIKRSQRRLARQQPGSKRRARTKRQIARSHRKRANIRRDFAHQTSRTLADSTARIFVYENLNVRGMTRRPTPKSDAQGTSWQRNGRAAKAGLNRSILASAWGMIILFVTYKALRLDKLTLTVTPYRSSQECAECGHTHPDNRRSQSEFVCVACGHAENADGNAARVLKRRGIKILLAGECPAKPARTRVSARGGQIRRLASTDAGASPKKREPGSSAPTVAA